VSAEDRQRIRGGIERLRLIVSRTPPWTVVTRDGLTVLWDTREDKALATLHGAWTPDVARYLRTMHPYAMLTMVELLWRVGHGMDIERHAVALINAMKLDDQPD
jgi:hypothetical protein